MQQTEKYQLNLIETGDTFSPAALNENAQKTEAAIEAARAEAAAATAAGDDALDQRVTALEIHKIAVGHFTGGTVQSFNLGFTPVMVLVVNSSTPNKPCSMAVTDYAPSSAGKKDIVIKENGFTANVAGYINLESHSYNYIALA